MLPVKNQVRAMTVIHECAQSGAEGQLLNTPDGLQCGTRHTRALEQARSEASCTQCGIQGVTESGVCSICESAPPLSQAEFEILAAAEAAMAKDHEEQQTKDNAVLSQVRQFVSAQAFQEIEVLLAESECFDYSIVALPIGEPQDDGYVLGSIYVDETMNGGLSGDSYAGTVCVSLGRGTYLKYNYTV